VFKKHTSQEAEDLFIYGTRRTTPPLFAVSSDWPKPWLYSRVLLGLVITFFLLKFAVDVFANPNAIPGVIFIGSTAFPVAMAFLFMEINVFRNISFYKTALVFLIGGAGALLTTILLYAFMLPDMQELGYVEALLVGIIEETGKFLIILFFIKKMPNCNYILNGLLIGALVGSGFAAFESAGYAFGCLLEDDLSAMYGNIYLRGFLSPGGHVAWSAMVGAAIIIGRESIQTSLTMGTILSNNHFWRIVIIPILLHFLWDCPLMPNIIKYIVLLIAAWVITLILIHMGLQEVNTLTNRTQKP
jgi:RsiW-degrading membrane proteinase PrsW (M82 family)